MVTVSETSAGGVVIDHRGPGSSVALIGKADRAGRPTWTLPKGHIEDGETLEQTAIREVREETGIVAEILRPLGTVDYWFVLNKKRIHKVVHHFLMVRESGELNADDREVDEVAWVAVDDVPQRLTYANERRLVDSLPALLAELE